MDDGVSIAATLYVPDGAPPAGGWPAIVFLHGLAGNRQQMNALVEGYGFTGQGLRGPHVRRARARRVRRARRDRRPARGRRHARDPRLARRASGRRRHEDRRLGHLLRRRRGLQLARRRRAVGGGRRRSRRGPISTPRSCRRGSRSPASSPGSQARSRPTRRDPSLDAVQAAAFAGNARRSASRGPPRARASRSSAPSRRPSSWPRGAATSCSASTRRARAFQRLEGPEAALCRPPRPRAVDVPRRRHRRPHDDGTRLVRLLPAQRRLRPRRASRRVASGEVGPGAPPASTLPPTRPTSVAFPGVTTFARSGKAVRTSAPLRKRRSRSSARRR